MRKKKLISSIVSTSLAVVLAVFLVFTGIATERETPLAPPTSKEALASPAMLVSPDESESDNDEADQNKQSDDEGDENNNNDSPESSQESESVPSPGKGGGTSNNGGPVANPGEGGTPVKEAGISTNLGNFRTLSAQTKSPDTGARTLEGRSGFDEDAGTLWFYAIPNEYAQGYSVEAAYQNSAMAGKKTLAGNNGLFSMPIIMDNGESATITLSLLDRTGKAAQVYNFIVTYVENDDSRHGPVITVHNIVNEQVFTTNEITLRVSAADYYSGEAIYSNRMKVELVGQTDVVGNPSATSPYDYKIFIAKDVTDDKTKRTIRISATDNFGASTTQDLTIYYESIPDGAAMGTVQVQVDLTTVGLGVLDTIPVTLHKNNPFPKDMYDAFESFYEIDYSGTFASNFYIKRLVSGGRFVGSLPDDQLWKRIEIDGITYSKSSRSDDSVGQFDYTGNSGWTYRVRGTTPSESLSGYNPIDGDVVSLIFTLNSYKDIGGNAAGALSSYCGTWMNGVYTPSHDYSVYLVRKEPTCTETGISYMACSVEYTYALEQQMTGDSEALYAFLADLGAVTNEQVLPITDHQWAYIPEESWDPTDTKPGLKFYRCSVCGATKQEESPATG